jgi:hypothetical protein
MYLQPEGQHTLEVEEISPIEKRRKRRCDPQRPWIPSGAASFNVRRSWSHEP